MNYEEPNYPRFNSSRICPKCGHPQRDVKYIQAHTRKINEGEMLVIADKLKVTCKRCGYICYERPRDYERESV